MRKLRVVIAKPGLDGHDRGAKVIARALRDAGMEVIYLGLRQTPEQIVAATLQEDADVIGLSILSGAHNHIAPRLMQLLKEKGLDGHDRGAKVIARALRDAGMEVIYTGLRQTPEQIVAAALQEDADVIGLSILSGAHNHIAPRLMELLKARGLDDVLVVIGGIIPDVDIPKLKDIGVKGIFLPGTPMQDIIDFINTNARQRGSVTSAR